jgi:ribonuclease BN (tRNA processing enzyme)
LIWARPHTSVTNPRHIFITHLHPDHAAFMAADVKPKATVYVPEPTRRLPGAQVISGPVRVHAGIPDLVEFFRPFTPQIVIAHFGSWFYRNIDDSIRKIESFGNGVRVAAAHDGLVIDI